MHAQNKNPSFSRWTH